MENIRLTYNPVENLAFHQLTEFVPLVFVLILKEADLVVCLFSPERRSPFSISRYLKAIQNHISHGG
jgi:hypothetical protein